MRIEQIGDSTLYLGDCREVIPGVKADAVLADPPYGGGLAMDYANRFTAKAGAWWKNTDRTLQARHDDITGDDAPFDPSPILALGLPSILWGGNWYASRLPDSGGWFVWDKRNGSRDVTAADWPMSEAELAWTNTGKGVRVFRHTWFGLIRDSERGEHHHPTQKPVALAGMACTCFAPPSALVADPFVGAGAMPCACERLDRTCHGMEIEPSYAAVTLDRMWKMGLEPKLLTD